MSFISPRWLSDGMFCDGLIYAAISKNLAHGLGSLWDLYFTSGFEQHFHGHPPLAFGLESLFFRVLGDSYLVERIYSFATYLVTGFVVVRIWKQVSGKQYFSLYWLPLLLWLFVPVVVWSVSNNLLENTMMIFTSLALLFGVKSYDSKRYLNLVLSGFMVFLAVMTKGPVGLFPLALPFWVFVFDKSVSFKRFLVDLTVMMATLVTSFLVLFVLIPPSFGSLYAYFNRQIATSFSRVVTVNSRFYILIRMFNELAPMFVALTLVAVLTRKIKFSGRKNRWMYVFLMMGLSGVVPIMVSLKQSGFYILPAFPVMGIALALYIVPEVKKLTEKIDVSKRGFKIFGYASILVLLMSLVINLSQINKVGRDKVLLGDVHSIANVVPGESTVAVGPKLSIDWLLAAYFWRYYNIDLNTKAPENSKYFLVTKDFNNTLPPGFKKDTVTLKMFNLYKRQ